MRGVWIYGPSGVGKSWSARRDFPGAYPKLCNKWWDGYQGQANVIMDDIGMEALYARSAVEALGDRYCVVLENKGGASTTVKIRNFVVTSQYSMEEIFGGDSKTLEALRRRFSRLSISRLISILLVGLLWLLRRIRRRRIRLLSTALLSTHTWLMNLRMRTWSSSLYSRIVN